MILDFSSSQIIVPDNNGLLSTCKYIDMNNQGLIYIFKFNRNYL